MKTRLYMVPIYITVGERFDHTVTLTGQLQFMEDHAGNMFVDTRRMIDCGQIHEDDFPEGMS